MSEQPIIDLEHVYVARGERLVLHDLCLQVRAGEHLAILGPNGCGKSTLLKVLTCELYPVPRPDTRVSLFGRPRWDVTQLRRRMGVVAAELPGEATKEISGFEAVLTGFFSSSKLWPNLCVTAVMRERAEDILTMVHAQDLRYRKVGQMSAGQQRRVMIARSLAGTGDGPNILLLDEPSNALDLAVQQELRALLSQLAERGTAILMITHHVSDVLPQMQRVILMKHGQIIADGGKQDLLTETRLGNVFDRQIRVAERDGVLFAW